MQPEAQERFRRAPKSTSRRPVLPMVSRPSGAAGYQPRASAAPPWVGRQANFIFKRHPKHLPPPAAQTSRPPPCGSQSAALQTPSQQKPGAVDDARYWIRSNPLGLLTLGCTVADQHFAILAFSAEVTLGGLRGESGLQG